MLSCKKPAGFTVTCYCKLGMIKINIVAQYITVEKNNVNAWQQNDYLANTELTCNYYENNQKQTQTLSRLSTLLLHSDSEFFLVLLRRHWF